MLGASSAKTLFDATTAIDGTGTTDTIGSATAPTETELLLRQVIDALPHLVWRATLDGRYFFLNKRWEEYTGIAAANQLGNSWTEQIHREDRPQLLTAWRNALTTGTDFQLHCRVRRFDGAYRWFETRGTPIRDTQGRVVNWFGTHTDVHEAYEALRHLSEQEERFRYVALATHDAIYDWDMRTGMTYCNDRFQELFAAPDIIGRNDAWWERHIHPDDYPRIQATANATFDAKLPTWSQEYRLKQHDGGYAVVTDRAYVVYDADNKPLRLIGAIADETARKETEQSLRDARARLLSAMQAGGLATWIWEVRDNIVHWDESAYRLWGRDRRDVGELSMEKIVSFLHPDDVQRAVDVLTHFYRTGKDTTLEFRSVRPDGALQWLVATGQVERDATGQPVRVAGVYIDITERKKIEQSLRDSQAGLKSAMQAGGLAIWTWDIVANEFTWDAHTCRLWGRRPDEFERLSYAQIIAMIHPEDRPRIAAANDVFMSSGDIASVEFRTLRPDGALQWLSTSGQVERDNDGKLVRMTGVYLDVTSRRQVEQSLRDTQARLKSAIQAAGLATWIWDIAKDELHWDEDAFQLWGRSPGEFDKLTLQQSIEMTHPDDRAAIAASNERFRHSGMPVPLEFRVLRPDNALQWLMTKSQIERDEQGQLKRVVGVYLDITERKRAEEARLNSQKMEALGTLAGGIAHDFNNILLAITGNAKLASTDLQSLLPSDNPALRSLTEIEKAATRAAELVRRILTFSRQQDATRELVSLQPLIEDALRLLRPTLRAAIEFRTHFEADVPPVVSEPIQIQQVVMNLVTNAAHAIGDKPGLIEISLTNAEFRTVSALATGSLPAGRYVCLTIGDSGSGIDATVIDRIFEPFFTTKQVGQGTGLGLSVVHGIVRAHGGAIGVDNQIGRGATLRVYFPAASGKVKEVNVKAPAQSAARGEHVLYVDDEEALVFLVGRVLERLGYRVTGCIDPEQALRELRARPHEFDVVVTDLSMHGMNGFDLTREVRKIRANLPVLLTSGFLRSEDREMAAKLGIRELILKPSTVEELGSAIDRTLKNL